MVTIPEWDDNKVLPPSIPTHRKGRNTKAGTDHLTLLSSYNSSLNSQPTGKG